MNIVDLAVTILPKAQALKRISTFQNYWELLLEASINIQQTNRFAPALSE